MESIIHYTYSTQSKHRLWLFVAAFIRHAESLRFSICRITTAQFREIETRNSEIPSVS